MMNPVPRGTQNQPFQNPNAQSPMMEEILRVVHFAVGKLFEKNQQEMDRKLKAMEERLDAIGLRRAKEVRQASISVQTQPFESQKNYTGTDDPDENIGSTGDFYEKTSGGVIVSRWHKPDGQWVKVGDYAVAVVTDWKIDISGDTLTGAINGSNQNFTTSSPYIAGSLTVDWNGVTYYAGSGVTEVDPAAGTFTLTAGTPKVTSPVQVVAARYKYNV